MQWYEAILHDAKKLKSDWYIYPSGAIRHNPINGGSCIYCPLSLLSESRFGEANFSCWLEVIRSYLDQFASAEEVLEKEALFIDAIDYYDNNLTNIRKSAMRILDPKIIES